MSQSTEVRSDPVLIARSRLGVASRRGVRASDPKRYAEARRDLTAAILERQINEAISAELPLTRETRRRLAALLRGV